MRAWIMAVVGAVSVTGCTLGIDGAVGKTCETANDCPEPLVCVQARGDTPTCESLAPPTVANFEPADAGVAYYCGDVERILNTYCVACHGVPPAGGAPPTLRLDTFESKNGIPGAHETAERTYARAVVDDSMPPGAPLPQEDQKVLTAWYRSGAQFCNDGGM